MPDPLLSNIVWHSLDGPHLHFSVGTPHARRYARGFSPILGFADPKQPDFAALAPHCEPGERLYCGGWSGSTPEGWQVDTDSFASQMIWTGGPPAHDTTLHPLRLGPADVPQVLALVEATQPGPFGERTVELGEHYGVFDAGRLVAMAGERFCAGQLREISAVCTHPDFQGRGLARRLVERLLRTILLRGEQPFLHVMDGNHAARRLYEHMGFCHRQEYAVRIVSRTA